MSVPPRIYHIAERARWMADDADYVPAGYAAEGFIHCSNASQVDRVAAARFTGRDDLVLLGISTADMGEALVYENTEGGEERFPHLYRALRRIEVVQVLPMRPRADGGFDPLVPANR